MPIWTQCGFSIIVLVATFFWFQYAGVRQKEMPEDIRSEPILSRTRAEWNEAQIFGLPCSAYVILYIVGILIGLHSIYRIFAGG